MKRGDSAADVHPTPHPNGLKADADVVEAMSSGPIGQCWALIQRWLMRVYICLMTKDITNVGASSCS
ncbi:hypothetical protein P4S72_17265 [Vibrio sp. PP-XX7]